MQVSKSKGPLLPDFDVVINGSSMPARSKIYIGDVSVDESVELPSMFTFGLGSSDAQNQQTPWVDDQGMFAIGSTVEIKMGYGEQLTSLIKGEITSLEPEFAVNRLPILRVRGYDRRHRLQRGRKTRTFVNHKDSEIASQIGGEAGLSVQAKDSKTVHSYILQASQTDWEFLQERAIRIRYEVVVQDRSLLFQPVANDKSPALTLDMVHGLLEFYPRLATCGQPTEVNVRSWSVKDKKNLVGKGKGGDEVSTMGGKSSGAAATKKAFRQSVSVIGAYPVPTQAEADQVAKALFNEAVLEFISGEGICTGRTDVRAGKVIKIDGIGSRFGGLYYVTSAVHRYLPTQSYQTYFVVRRNAS